jgi:hypothetical protein
MGVSATGGGLRAAPLRHAIATVLVFLAVFYFFYGPPLTPAMAESAHRECNRMTGATYRTYRLEWRTTTYASLHRPEWVCRSTSDPQDVGAGLGWWTGV